MLLQIRRGVFETNSSSVHSITMCDESEFDRFKEGKLVYDRYNDTLVEVKELPDNWKDSGEYITYDEFFHEGVLEKETFIDRYETPKGDKVIAFGYYGYDW